MSEFEKAFIKLVKKAMSKTEGWGTCWWLDEWIGDILYSAEKLGWVVRISTTQIHWTDCGCELAREASK